jgi:glycosyltransferase involved in cell wall biosynthesis
MNPTRILFVSNTGSIIGGGEISLLDLLAGLDRDQYAPTLVVPESGEVQAEAEALNVPCHVIALPSVRRPHLAQAQNLVRLARLCRAHALVHANGSRAMVYAGLAGRLTGTPVLWHVRVTDPDPLLDRLLAPLATRILVNANAVRARFPFVHSERIRVAYNGVDLTRFRSAPPNQALLESLGLRPGTPVVLYAGRLEAAKGIQTLLDALRLIAAKRPDVVWLLAGDGPERDRIQTELADAGLTAHVRLLGNRRDLPALCNLTTLAVLPSLTEAFGRVLIEAMASGCPVVASHVGGIPEVIATPEVGTLVPPADPLALANACLAILDDPARATQMGRNATRYAASRFSRRAHVDTVQTAYADILAGSTHRPQTSLTSRPPLEDMSGTGRWVGAPIFTPTHPAKFPLKIALDCREFVPGRTTGIASFLYGILTEIARRPHLQALALALPDSPIPVCAPNLSVRRLAGGPTLRWDQVLAPRALAEWGADVFFSPYYKAPLRTDCPTVVTIHDLIPIQFPAYRSGSARPFALAFQVWAGVLAHRAAAVVTDSEASKTAIEDLLGLAPGRIHVQPLGIPAQFRPDQDPAHVKAALARYGIRQPYLLSVGNFLPHKNLRQLVRAYEALPAIIRQRVQLVLAGTPGGHGAAQPIPAADLDRPGVHRTGFVASEDLPRLYAGALALVCPSLAEGFGLPVAEAICCGTPVACANATSLPEVAGDAALYFDPECLPDILHTLFRIIEDGDLRNHLRAKALRRRAAFSPHATTTQLVDLLEQVGR